MAETAQRGQEWQSTVCDWWGSWQGRNDRSNEPIAFSLYNYNIYYMLYIIWYI